VFPLSWYITILSLIFFPSSDTQFAEEASPAAVDLVSGCNTFTMDLYRHMASGDGNLAISPFSAHNVLLMTYMGARGKTADEMAGVLHLDKVRGVEPAAYSHMHRELVAGSSADGRQFELANALWVEQASPVRSTFEKLMRVSFRADVKEVIFHDPKELENTRAKINAWGRHKTHGMIPESLPRGVINPATRMVLSNAVWFKAFWAVQFPKDKTKLHDFSTLDSAVVSVPMMHLSSEDLRGSNRDRGYAPLRATETDEFQLLELPYRQGKASMLVLLPRVRDGLPAIETKMDCALLAEAMTRLKPPQAYEVFLPKVKLQSSLNLAQALSAMGMARAFGDADFSGIGEGGGLFISDVVQSAVVDVNEEGTEAAAVTHVMIASGIHETFIFVADHPYLFFIRDNTTGALLFAGRVTNPQLLQ
jgi:serpin B